MRSFNIKSFILGAILGAVAAVIAVLMMLQPSGGPSMLHVRNVGTNAISLNSVGGQLPRRLKLRFTERPVKGLPIPVLEPKRYWGVALQPGQSASMPFGPGGTIEALLEPDNGFRVPRALWTGKARTLVAEINADDRSNIQFRITSQTP